MTKLKIMRYVLLLVIILTSYLNVGAQTTLRLKDKNRTTKAPRHSTVENTFNNKYKKSYSKQKRAIAQDTLYCTLTKKQHGWFSPLDTVSAETAKHCSKVFRFTKKNRAGKWCRMETLNGYGKYIYGIFSPYILNVWAAESDSSANKEWVEKLGTSCIYDFVSDPTGETIIQERVCDEKHNIVYIYSRTRISDNKYIGSYKDSYGLPAEMRKDKNYTYGTLVKLTEDKWGNDSIVEYMDAKGINKSNSDGVAMTAYTYDKYGCHLRKLSCNAKGKPILDNWGNCSVEYTYDKNHNIVSSVYLDDKLKNMRMPEVRAVGAEANAMKTLWKYDKYRRLIETAFYDNENKPDTNKWGAHRICTTFNERGFIIRTDGYDLKGELTQSDNNSGTSSTSYKYDGEGRETDIAWYDKKGNYVSTDGYLCRRHFEYDSTGNETLEQSWCMVDGKEKESYCHKKGANNKYAKYNDGSYQIDSIDVKGRTVYIVKYDKNGHLIKGADTWAKYTSEYKDSPYGCVNESNYYDENENPVDSGCAKQIVVVDSVGHTTLTSRYDNNGNLIETYKHNFNSDFSKVLIQTDMNAFGNICRAGGTSTVRYYKANMLYNQKGGFVSYIGKDEFDEPDYIGGDILYYYRNLNVSGFRDYDEDNKEITGVKSFRDLCPKVMSLEITDSIGYKKGLKDNDVIIKYGDYVASLDSMSYDDFKSEWALRCVLDADKNKQMVVFRIDPITLKYGLVRIDNLCGAPSDNGFMAHVRFLTQKQKKRIMETAKQDTEVYAQIVALMNGEKDERRSHDVVLGFSEMYLKDRYEPYPKTVKDPTILLGACVKDYGQYWVADKMDQNFLKNILSYRQTHSNSPTMNFYLTKNLHDIIDLKVTQQYAKFNVISYNVNDSDYNKILKLTNTVNKQIETQKTSQQFKVKDIVRPWLSAHEDSTISTIDYLDLVKDGTYNSRIKVKMKENVTGNIYLLMECSLQMKGTWSTFGSVLSLNESKDDTKISLDSLTIEGYNGDDKETILIQAKEYAKQNESGFLNTVKSTCSIANAQYVIVRASSKELVLKDGTEETIYVRTKKQQ